MSTIEETLASLVTRAAPSLGTKLHADRAAAISAAQGAVNDACDVERAALSHRLEALAVSRDERLAEITLCAERTRRARADALLADIFATGAGSLPALIKADCTEPSRVISGKIWTGWGDLNARAIAEIGAPIYAVVFGALLCDEIVARPGLAPALAAFSCRGFNGPTNTFESLHACTVATDPASMQLALATAERELLDVARRWVRNYPGLEPTSDQRAMYTLYRTCATHRDYMQSREALEAEQGAARNAEMLRNAEPMIPGGWRKRFGFGDTKPPVKATVFDPPPAA